MDVQKKGGIHRKPWRYRGNFDNYPPVIAGWNKKVSRKPAVDSSLNLNCWVDCRWRWREGTSVPRRVNHPSYCNHQLVVDWDFTVLSRVTIVSQNQPPVHMIHMISRLHHMDMSTIHLQGCSATTCKKSQSQMKCTSQYPPCGAIDLREFGVEKWNLIRSKLGRSWSLQSLGASWIRWLDLEVS